MTTSTGYEYRYYCTENGDLTTDLIAVVEQTKRTHLNNIYKIDTDMSLNELDEAMDSYDPEGELDILVNIEDCVNGTRLSLMYKSEIEAEINV